MSATDDAAPIDHAGPEANGARRPTPEASEPAMQGLRVAPETWIRRDDTGRALAVILSGFAALVFAVLTVIGLFALPSDAPAGTVMAIVGMFAALAVCFAWLAARLLGTGVRIDPDEVRVRGLLRTRRIPIAEVERFEPGILRSLPGHDEVGVRCLRSDGGGMDIWAIAAGGAVGEAGRAEGRAALEPLCDELNELLESTRLGWPGARHAGGTQGRG